MKSIYPFFFFFLFFLKNILRFTVFFKSTVCLHVSRNHVTIRQSRSLLCYRMLRWCNIIILVLTLMFVHLYKLMLSIADAAALLKHCIRWKGLGGGGVLQWLACGCKVETGDNILGRLHHHFELTLLARLKGHNNLLFRAPHRNVG